MPRIDDLRAGAVQYRSATVEDMDAAKGEVRLKAVPYSDEYRDIGGGIHERFTAGAFARSLKSPEHISLWKGHGGARIGFGIEGEDRADGVWLRMRLGRSTAAKDALLDLEDSIAADPSIEFRPMAEWMKVEQRGAGLAVTHRRAILMGVALVPDGAYHGAAYVESVREAQAERAREEARLWFEAWRKG